ncbi:MULTISPECIES: hypothetical protein [Aeromonas]|uniref:hypothetical protein n=1 Tax=Aeromonas TaxID=642 RepID=UPI0005A844C5|nr:MULTISPECIES: hypothetical protein [Aeromonas]MCX4043213.1 hypothetical protein [Aeromonas veronii]OKP41265.1 hypothetical protein BJP22_08215 [Aeromonas veronii]QWZ82918.1 hypothetical protein I6L44_08480 [Aeromonas sp. FDAARGOS 1414]UDN21418.1 hypothetical protein LEO77_12500 [Aeromonas veronii]HDN9004749.1 hypothetical protein [Aeromonas veronii]
MHKIGMLTTLLLANVTAAHAEAQAVFGRLASAPVQQFNQQIRQANELHQKWVNDYREVALRFVGHSDIPSRIHAQQLDNDLVLSVALDGSKNDMLYILTLYRSDNLWQMRGAEMGWRCLGEHSFTPVPCP